MTWMTYVPQQWRKAEITPILKKGKPAHFAESYRPISLTSACCKVAEKMVTSRLQQYIEAEGIIDKAQAGFREYRSTIDHVASLTQHIKDGYHRKMSTLAVLVDFKAAYDTVWRSMLIHKLALHGISGNLFKWIKSSLSQRQIRVKFSNTKSKFRIQKQGLAQGAILSCILFNLMINDILHSVREVPGIQALLYADDLIIWATSSNILALETCLNQALQKLEMWSRHNSMTVNGSKTTFQLFTLSTKAPKITLSYQDSPLKESDISQYLGVQLDRRLSWKPHIEQCAEKALKRTRLLKRLTATTWGAKQDILITAYKSYIRPVLQYGNEVINTASNSTINTLDLVQNTALRVITGAPKSTPIAAMEAQTNIEPLTVYREKSTLRFWERYKRVYSHQWTNYRQATSRLKTQTTPFIAYQNLLTKYNITPGDPAPFITHQNVHHHLPPAKYSLKNHNLPKYATPEPELRQTALQTIIEEYPEEDWLHIYTDGSSIPGTGETGAAYYCRLFQGHLAVGAPLSNYDGEVAAVLAAASELEAISPPFKAVFLIDSQATIRNLSFNTKTDCQRTGACRSKLERLIQAGWELQLQWVPSHIGILGNEKADHLAKLGTTLPQPATLATLSTAKAHVSTAVNIWYKQHQLRQAAGKRWESLVTHGPIDHSLPRAVGVAAFRMKTGHDYLAAHLHRLRVLPTAECVLCGHAVMDSDHIKICSGLDHSQQDVSPLYAEARLYWSARHQMAQQPRVGVG